MTITTAERVIPADPAAIFAVLADPAQHPVIDGSGMVRSSQQDNPTRLSKGATFSVGMRQVVPYVIRNTVTEFEEGRCIAWQHVLGNRWRYVLTPVDGGTLVREEYDLTAMPALSRLVLRLLRYPQRSQRAMQATLTRLADEVTC